MSDIAEILAAQLRDGGVDPVNFLTYAVPAADAVSGGDADLRRNLLVRMAELTRSFSAAGMDNWNPWRFGVQELSQAFDDDAVAFTSLLADLEALVQALAKRGLEDTVLQRLPASIQAAAGRPWIAKVVLDVAREMVDAGTDPGDALRIALPAIADAVTGRPPADYEGNRPEGPAPNREVEEPRFAPVAAALREAFTEMHAHGIPPSSPIAQGVAAIARTYAGDAPAMAERLRELTELCLTLHDHGIVPHPSVEYGIVAAFDQVGQEAWLRDEVFPLAFAIASAGKEPGLALTRMAALYGFGPERGPQIANRLRARAELGLDVGRLLATVNAMQYVGGGEEGQEDRVDGLLVSCESLLEALQAAGMRPMQTFEEGLPEIVRTPHGVLHFERVIAIARRLVRASIDPGPVLQHGVRTAFLHMIDANEDPALWEPVVETMLTSTNALLDANVNPWPFLAPGVPCAIRVARGNPAVARELVEEIRDLALELARTGVDPAPLLGGFHNLGIELGGQREVFSATVQSLRAFAPALKARGIDPIASAGAGLAEAARLAHETGAGWLVSGAADLGRRLAEAGIEPAGVLKTALPALVRAAGSTREALDPLFEDVLRTEVALRAATSVKPALPLHQVIDDASPREGEHGAASVRDAMRLVRESAAKGLDASALAAAAIPVIEAQESWGALYEALAAAVATLPPGSGSAYASAAASAAEVAGPDASAFASGLASLLEVWKLCGASETEPDPGAIFSRGAPTAALVAGTRASVWSSTMQALAGRIARAKKDGVDASPALEKGGWSAARAAAGREQVFVETIDVLVRIAGKRGKPDDEIGALLAEHVAPLAILGADGDAQEIVQGLEDVAQLRESLGAVEGSQWLIPWVSRFGDLVRRVPGAWRNLLVPVLRSNAAGASNLLNAIERLRDRIEGDEAVSLLKHVVTQEGVRAPEILWMLLVQGTSTGTIRSLAEERELLLGFLKDVPVVDSGFYEKYRAIMQDEAKSEAEKRTAIEALGNGVAGLAEAIVSGEVPESMQGDPLLPHVLFHVFPPAVSVTRDRYLALFKNRIDHPGHPAILGGPSKTPPPLSEIKLPRGGYRLRDDAVVEPEPFELLKAAVLAVHAQTGEEDLDKLGVELFAAWIGGTIATSKARETFLQRIYHCHHDAGHSLPESPTSAEEMLRYREFLADAAREIVQEAFRAARAADPDRYDAQARAKLSPRPFVGPGLVRSVWRTVESARSGAITAAIARERITRQLKGFEVSGGGDDRVLACADRAALEALLPSLPVKGAEVELGNEHVRALQELAGAELAAIQRELFGDGETKGKLEYRDDAEKHGLVLELEVTKRRAHVPIGFCEGVCTAIDEELWNQPRFLQVVIWGEDDSPGAAGKRRRRRARGGMHLLVVEREGQPSVLALPGINPSLDLLAEAGPKAILDALLEYAIGLAKRAGFGAVWIPDNPGILSNRGPIHAALAEKTLPSKGVPSVTFSYRPYGYTFERVLTVWEAAPPPSS